MEFKKILEQTDRYDIVQWKFQGMPITFRIWKDGSQIVEIRVDEHFAKANGYKSVDDMAENTIQILIIYFHTTSTHHFCHIL